MADNTNVAFHDGYQTYFNFVTGFAQAEANITSTETIDKSFEGKVYVIHFTDGSKIVVGYKLEGSEHFTVSNDASGKPVVIDTDVGIHVWVLSPSQDISLVGDPQPYIVDLGTQTVLNGSLYASNFLSQWLSANNVIQPPELESIHGNQVIHGYGGRDDLSGALGNDTIFLDVAGLTHMGGGRSGSNPSLDNMPSGNDTFVLMPHVIIPGDSGRTTTISGTELNFLSAPQSGEVNTIEARGNNDLSLADIFWINKIVFKGASLLQFGGGNFFSNNHIAANATVVGDAGADVFKVWANPKSISPGHSDSHGAPDIDLSHLHFLSWTTADHVTIVADQIGTAGGAVIKAPNVPTTIIGGPQSYGDELHGGSANDTIIGGTRDCKLYGNGGNDALTGNVHKDTILGGAGFDTLRGGGDADVLNGGTNGDKVYGDGGPDNLFGGPGIDTLQGGLGKDTLSGGSEHDVFDFNALIESPVGPSNRDYIADFQHGIDDIDLRTIDAKPGGVDNPFTWIIQQPFHHVKGELHYKDLGATCLVQGDTDGNGAANFEILVHSATLAKADFLL